MEIGEVRTQRKWRSEKGEKMETIHWRGRKDEESRAGDKTSGRRRRGRRR